MHAPGPTRYPLWWAPSSGWDLVRRLCPGLDAVLPDEEARAGTELTVGLPASERAQPQIFRKSQSLRLGRALWCRRSDESSPHRRTRRLWHLDNQTPRHSEYAG